MDKDQKKHLKSGFVRGWELVLQTRKRESAPPVRDESLSARRRPQLELTCDSITYVRCEFSKIGSSEVDAREKKFKKKIFKHLDNQMVIKRRERELIASN